MASRQAQWQKKKVASGLCSTCGDPQLPKSDRCFRHYVMKVLAQNGLAAKEHKGTVGPRLENNRTMFISFLWGRYQYTKMNGSPPEAVPNWSDIGFGIYADAQTKLDRVVLTLDRKATREYGRANSEITESNSN
jgi:hypothetical protein